VPHGKGASRDDRVTTGRLLGAIAAGFIYLAEPGLPFIASGVICLVAGLIVLLPRLARLFPAPSQRAADAATREPQR
jgi:hypothetical protein